MTIKKQFKTQQLLYYRKTTKNNETTCYGGNTHTASVTAPKQSVHSRDCFGVSRLAMTRGICVCFER
jgi:hypothetical protein